MKGWKNYGKTFEEFENDGLNAPGVLIKIESGGTFLIGHINEIRGVCDDCVEFEDHEIVSCYRVVWEEEK